MLEEKKQINLLLQKKAKEVQPLCMWCLQNSQQFLLEPVAQTGNMARTEGILQERWRGTFTRAWSDRTKANSFTLTESSFRLDIGKKILPCKGGETLADVAQRRYGRVIHGSIQG